ncbi:MAG: hypothetical protein LBP57_03185 [Endomicrobium sp.]|nr:hypothetical protein [Endomicrobium sp.]
MFASTIKPIIGHTLGACGALETLTCVISGVRSIIPPTYCEDVVVDEDLDLNYCLIHLDGWKVSIF